MTKSYEICIFSGYLKIIFGCFSALFVMLCHSALKKIHIFDTLFGNSAFLISFEGRLTSVDSTHRCPRLALGGQITYIWNLPFLSPSIFSTFFRCLMY